MFDEPTSLPMHAAVASLLGGLFSIGLIVATHTTAQAQSEQPVMTLRSLPGVELTADGRVPGGRGLRLDEKSSAADSGPRWQLVQLKGLRGEGEAQRRRDPINVGVQVRF